MCIYSYSYTYRKVCLSIKNILPPSVLEVSWLLTGWTGDGADLRIRNITCWRPRQSRSRWCLSTRLPNFDNWNDWTLHLTFLIHLSKGVGSNYFFLHLGLMDKSLDMQFSAVKHRQNWHNCFLCMCVSERIGQSQSCDITQTSKHRSGILMSHNISIVA